jgi:(1->4)-alpha-D-glucan 1-alpha-D-glucosylmutase
MERDEPYERSCEAFIDRIMDHSTEFWNDFLSFHRDVAAYGIFNSLSQTLLKMTSPGVPDFYQGSELWDFRLVDPDNRRPVDFEKRKKLLDEIIEYEDGEKTSDFIHELLKTREDGRIKLFLIFKVLNARRNRTELFEKGDYQPLKARGKYGNHIVGFLRRFGNQNAMTIAPRFLTSLINTHELPLGTDLWHDTEIFWPASIEGHWRQVVTGESINILKAVPVGQILAKFPVALLIRT